jgi:hypothetical protein
VIATRIYVAEAGESAPFGARRVQLSDAAYQLHAFLAGAELSFTPRAESLLAGYPSGGTRSNLSRLVSAGHLVLYDPTPARALRGGTMRREAAPTEPPVPPAPETVTGWIEVELVTEDHRPVANEKYRIVLPDGSIREGHLDAQGQTRQEGIDPGTCHISFPELRRTHADS